jgi:hypothetical protein
MKNTPQSSSDEVLNADGTFKAGLGETVRTEPADESSSINTTPHLNRSRVKQTALEIVKRERPFWKASRVSMSFLEAIEADTRAAILRRIKQHPTKGRTLQ